MSSRPLHRALVGNRLGEAEATGANPTDRGKPGSKRHTLTDGAGIPLSLMLTGANRPDMKLVAAVLDGVVLARSLLWDAAIGDWVALPCQLCLDRGYAYAECRQAAERRGYTVPLPPPGYRPLGASSRSP